MKEVTIDYWYCPNCKYRVSDTEYQAIRFDPLCRCGIHNWSMFNCKSKKIKED